MAVLVWGGLILSLVGYGFDSIPLLIIGIGCIVVFLWLLFIYPKTKAYKKKTEEAEVKAAAEKEKRDKLFSFDKENSIINLKARDATIVNYISIIDAVDLNFKYEPEKLHIGAVAVGGVVSGGTYTTGGYYYLDSAKKNGLCIMKYGDELISAIQLTDDLFKQAENSEISQYLDKSTKQIIVRVHERGSLEELQEAMNNLRTTGYAGNTIARKGLPTLEKAAKILKWMAGE